MTSLNPNPSIPISPVNVGCSHGSTFLHRHFRWPIFHSYLRTAVAARLAVVSCKVFNCEIRTGELYVHHGSLIQQCSLRDRNWSRCSCGTAYNDECMGLTFQSPTTSENSLALSPSLHSDQRLHTTSLYPLFTSFENTIFRMIR